ncbi:putative elongator complex protein 1 isoform X2 [Nylanderia fulva]|uniref:putative elongator complex protein 1 isoform X2 n=1 Tax=Nylanderia fulva TaxID=613905 RepID=UPI0010FBB230|nr:putative elongator complex protein 1 isoform X2 [Nylanderia fulva]
MKNLAVHGIRRRNVERLKDIAVGYDFRPLQPVHCVLNSNNELYILFDNQRLYRISTLDDRNEDVDSSIVADICGDENCKVVGFEYCVTKQEMYCAYESGVIVKLNTTDKLSFEHFEQEMIMCTADLECMKLSPDNEIITAVTVDGILYVAMVSDFDIISEVNLYSEDFGEKQFVTVGWGKKETQFHGLAGKAAAKVKQEQLSSNEFDDCRPRITWREDGALFAVSFLNDLSTIRQFKVFDRKGTLYYTCEPTNGLEECLAWQPLGNLIATTQRLVNKHVVALFEKNGLKYAEFPLPFAPREVKVKDLLWSPNSDILAIICEPFETLNTILQLYTENNCHWYLKQTITFSVENPLIYAIWSTENYEKLILLTLKEIIFCSFNWCVNHSRGKTVDDNTVVAVIDGNKTLVTSFRDGIIPPPMAHQFLQMQEPVNAIAFAPSNNDKTSLINSNMFCTVSWSNKLTFFKRIMDSSITEYEVLWSYNIEFSTLSIMGIDNCVYAMHHLLWLAEDIILFSITTNEHNLLCILSLDAILKGKKIIKLNSEENILAIQKVFFVENSIENIIPSSDINAAYIMMNRGEVFKYTRGANKLESQNMILRERHLYYVEVVKVEVIKIDLKDIIIALFCTNCLSIDGKEIAKNITSFYVHSDFLLLTTQQHTLICVPLNESGIQQLSKHDLTVKPWENGSNEISLADIYIRRVEKNSHLIAAISQDSKTILQMPRGNLECIEPRALSLHILKSYLNNCNYQTAFHIMKKQRINLNLIYDHDPKLFMDNAEKFVEEITNSGSLSLFLSELQNEDVTRTMYANCYSSRPVGWITTSGSDETKVNKVCKLLRDIMERRHDAGNLIQPILVSLVKNHEKQGLEKALAKVKQVKLLEDSQKSVRFRSSTSAEDALKYLLHFVNIDILYDIALGMYDFELAMFVASKSSKDPKEYIPYLNSLKKLSENYMKYSIDMHLKRYESALEHISKDSTKFEECFNLVLHQKLYSKALKLFKIGSTEHKRIARAYGEFLLIKTKYQEAGMMFYRSGDLDRAFKAFCTLGDSWQDAIAVSREMKLSSSDSRELYELLVKCLKVERNYEDAATILKDYLNDVEEAVAILCEGKIWKRAIRIAHDVQRLDLCETHIKPGVMEHAEHVMLQLDSFKEDFLRHKSRLASIRSEISARQMRSFSESICDEPVFGKEITDSLSETSSIAGSVSSKKSRTSTASRSYRSNKNRRKQERKLLSLKEGSTFEDLGLIHALYQIITTTYKNRDEWSRLVQTLIRFEFDECAEKLLSKINNFFKLVESSKSEIWNKSAPTSLTELEKMTIYTPAQIQEITAPIKLVERYITHPPETDITSCVSDIF